MAKQTIFLGNTANDRTGDPLRTAFQKVNENFDELYNLANADVQIPTQTGNNGKFLTTDGSNLSWATVSGGGSFDQSLNMSDNVTFNSVTGDLRVTSNIVSKGTTGTTIGPASQAVIFTAPSWMTGIKLTIVVEGNIDSDGTFTDHTQTCEATIAATYNTSAEPIMSVYGLAYTSTNPLATFAIQRNIDDEIEVVATNIQGTQYLYIKVHSTQFVSHYD